MTTTSADPNTDLDPILNALDETPDSTSPTVQISDNLVGTVNRSTPGLTYTLTFSESVSGLEASDFTLSNATLAGVSGSGNIWTVNVIPAAEASGSISLTLKADAVTDAAGNGNAATTDSSQAIDSKAPVAPKLVTDEGFTSLINPQVTFTTTLGTYVLELYPDAAPVTVANMLAYVNTDFYDGTLIHRVEQNFVIQGGGYNTGLAYKTPTYGPIVLESDNGLSNLRGTVAMARTSVADSATSQFFVNLADNTFLNHASSASPGYAVFGSVVSGMNVIDSMAQQPALLISGMHVPITEIVITAASQTLAGSARSNSGTFSVSGLEANATWEYSLDGGTQWHSGSGSSLAVPDGSYASNAILLRQTDAAGNLSLMNGLFGSSLLVDTSAPTATTFSPADATDRVFLRTDIDITFSEAIQRGNGEIILKTTGGTVVETFAVATSDRVSITAGVLSIDPTNDLASGTEYLIEIPAGALTDLAGNDYAGLIGYTFTTVETAEAVTGSGDDDTLQLSSGDDVVDGLAGTDAATYTQREAAYQITSNTGTRTVDGPEGADKFMDVERLAFSDVSLAFDVDDNAGQVYRLYQAAFARTPDLPGLGGWITAMDSGQSLDQVAAAFAASEEFLNLYGATTSNEEFVTLLYLNALGRAPDGAGLDYWTNQIGSGLQTRAQVLAQFSESNENKEAVAGKIAGGIFYAADSTQADIARQGLDLTGTSGADMLIGSVGPDRLSGLGGDDSLDGGAGIDTATFSGARANYSVIRTAAGLSVVSSAEGTDTLTDIERLQFSDGALAFDTSGNAGQVYRLYQAAFDRTPDTPGLSDWIRGMDAGMTLQKVASGFIASDEFKNLYGNDPTDTAFIDLLYQNVLDRAPDSAGQAYWLDELERGMTRELALIGFSESDENQAALIGVIQDGIPISLG